MGALPNPFLTIFGISRGRVIDHGLFAIGNARLPSDAIGNFILTLTNVVVGSAIQIETQDGSSTLYNGVAATSSPTINLSAYANGSAYNDLRIKVRKGTSSPYYRAYETLMTATAGAASIYVSQIPDE